jgi:hypothetical protein
MQREVENLIQFNKAVSYLKGDLDAFWDDDNAVEGKDSKTKKNEASLLEKVKVARKRTVGIVKDMLKLKTNKEREQYLIQRFIVESISDFKQAVAQQYFFKNINSFENCVKLRIQLLCLISLSALVFSMFVVIFYCGMKNYIRIIYYY